MFSFFNSVNNVMAPTAEVMNMKDIHLRQSLVEDLPAPWPSERVSPRMWIRHGPHVVRAACPHTVGAGSRSESTPPLPCRMLVVWAGGVVWGCVIQGYGWWIGVGLLRFHPKICLLF